MPSAKLYNQQGEAIGTVELDANVFGVKPNRGLIEQAVVTQLSNRRQPLAHTQTKGDVRGGGRKPWKQKGTGRARHGSIRSPQWKGGGIVHGPRSNRSYARKMNIKAKRQALLMSLSDKAQAERVSIVDTFQLPEAKTKLMAKFFSKLPARKTSLFILPASAPLTVRAGRNIPGLTFIRADSLNVYDIIKHQQLVILQAALPVIQKTYLK